MNNIIKTIINAYKGMLLYLIDKKKLYKKDVWLVGGHGGKLFDDNSKIMFEYINNRLKDIDVYWIVDLEAECIDEINKIGKTVIKGSYQNYIMFLRAKVVIFSHSLSSDIAPYAYVIPGFRKKYNQKLKVFISHGVEGLKKKSIVNKGFKNMKENILKGYDLQFAIGDFEEKIKINDWGIDKRKIDITGLPRFDKLQCNESKNEILYMPTWRPWIKYSNIKESDYYNTIINLISNEFLSEYLEKHNIKLNICIHQLMHEYFNDFNIELPKNVILLPRNTNIQNQLINCKLLITDYSSVCWDMLFMAKPVLFFQFDIDRYEDEVGSYLDLKSDLFGDSVYNTQDCINEIVDIIENKFEIKPIFLEQRKRYLKYVDYNNTKRVIESIKKRL